MNRKKTQVDLAKDLWINPRSNMRGPDGKPGKNNEGTVSLSNGSRFLELADIALGTAEPPPKSKRAA